MSFVGAATRIGTVYGLCRARDLRCDADPAQRPELPATQAHWRQGQGERDDAGQTEVQTERARFIVYPLLLTPETGRVTGGCELTVPATSPESRCDAHPPLTTALSLALTSATLVLAALAARPGTHSS